MINTIESSSVLRARLRDHLRKLKLLDPLPCRREETRSFRLKLLHAYNSVCGYCSRAGAVDAAHIIPLEIGGLTEDENLILLCKNCHRLYDTGHLSINAMGQIAEDWRLGLNPDRRQSPLRSQTAPAPTITPPPPAVRSAFEAAQQAQRERKFVKGINILNKRLADPRVDRASKIYMMIKRAELTRRRAARDVLSCALRDLDQFDSATIPPEYHRVYFYELMYVHRLMGNHALALEVARRGLSACRNRAANNLTGLDYVAAAANEILCEMALTNNLTKRHATNYENRFKELHRLSIAHGSYWGGRWALNCAFHRLQIRIKADDGRGSWDALGRLRKIYFDADVATGWDAGGHQTMSLLDGLVRVLFPGDQSDLDNGIGFLARSFLSRLGRRQRLEGIRDAGFGLAIGLEKRRIPDMMQSAQLLKHLMEMTVDGTSVIWPWLAP